jgi:hypothetical protein
MSIAQSEKTLPLRTLRNSAEFAEETMDLFLREDHAAQFTDY